MAELTLGRLEDAASACREALRLKPHLVEAHDNLGVVYLQLGQISEAVAHLREALRLSPAFAKAHFHLGWCLELGGERAEARSSYERALRLDPRYAEAFYRVGRLLSENAEFEEAEAYIRHAVELKPDYVEGLIGLGTMIATRAAGEGDLRSARGYLDQAISMQPNESGAHYALARLAQLEGHFSDAVEHYDRALSLRSDFPDAIAGKVMALERMGQVEQGHAIIAPLIRSDVPNATMALAGAAVARNDEQRQAAIGYLTQSLDKEKTRGLRIDLHFALGKLLDEMGDYDLAFPHFEKANALGAGKFDADKNAAWFERIMCTYDADRIAALDRAPNMDARPIFIVGMPRSGTSLVEQILASHPSVYGAGELTKLNDIVQSLPRLSNSDQGFPDCVPNLTSDLLQTAADEYLSLIGQLAGPDALKVTDKMPHNFVCLGFIEQLLPAARVVHCVRDPLDTCLSIFFEKFNHHHLYANNLEHLGIYYKQYTGLMAHWRSVLRMPMLELRYEDLIANQEAVTRELIDFCGLPWDERCLQFHESRRIVATPSYNQVRKPLYKKSVGRWRNYDRHIGVLNAQLDT